MDVSNMCDVERGEEGRTEAHGCRSMWRQADKQKWSATHDFGHRREWMVARSVCPSSRK